MKQRGKPATRRAMLRAIRTARAETASRHAAVLESAARVFDEQLDSAEQLEVAEELVLTRSAELMHAYPNTVGTSFGFRRKRDESGRRHRIEATPCVRFLVTAKWPRRGRRVRRGAIPSRLLATALVGGRRVLCAVPTDVEEVALYTNVVAHSGDVTVSHDGTTEHGVITCTLARDAFPDDLWALGCRHVFSVSDRFLGTDVWDLPVRVDGAAAAATRAVAGPLGPGLSFDAQLAEVTRWEVLREYFDGVTLTGYARSVRDLAGLPEYHILTPHGPVTAAFVDVIPSRPLYRLAGVNITHEWLVQIEPVSPVIAGDSGSPVVSALGGGMLLGMHVAGSAAAVPMRKAFMIPAWQLLDPSRYAGASGEVWTLKAP